MITIKKDKNLTELAEITKTESQVIVQSIINTIDPFILDDFLAGMTLGKFINEIGYTIEDFINGLHIHASIPISVLDSSISDTLLKLKFWYEGADEPCKNCGYDILWTDDDLAIHGVLEGRCPICHLAVTREV